MQRAAQEGVLKFSIESLNLEIIPDQFENLHFWTYEPFISTSNKERTILNFKIANSVDEYPCFVKMIVN